MINAYIQHSEEHLKVLESKLNAIRTQIEKETDRTVLQALYAEAHKLKLMQIEVRGKLKEVDDELKKLAIQRTEIAKYLMPAIMDKSQRCNRNPKEVVELALEYADELLKQANKHG